MSTFRRATSQKLTLRINFEESRVLGSTVIKMEQDRESRNIILFAQQFTTIESISVGKQKAR
jgi:hypothetical protein